ncbi:MAG TPA: hypothetical protein VLK58_05905 [Conexibacter sp.]|nr:hypothetical protein [Conexibacter sp.]
MFSSARALVTAGAAVLALAATVPAAQARVRSLYSAWADVTVTYAAAEATEGGQVTRDTTAKLVMRRVTHNLRFVDGQLVSQGVLETAGFDVAEAKSHYVNRDVQPAEDYTCETAEVDNEFPGAITPMGAFAHRASPTEFGFTPVTLARLDLRCGANGGRFMGLGGRMYGPRDLGPDHLRTRIEIPRQQLGDSEIVVPFSATSRSLARCPGDVIQPNVRSCVTTLAGKIRFYRTYIDPPPADELALAPLTPSRARLDSTATRASTTVRCPRGCSYRIRVFLPPRAGRGRIGGASSAAPRTRASAAAAREIVVATKAGKLPASRAARTLTLAIPAGRRAEVVADGGALIDVTLDPPKGRTVSSTSFARAG